VGYITVRLPFNIGGAGASKVLATAWLFKVASHRMLGLAKGASALPATDIGWKSTYRKAAYGVIPNRRYADGVIVLVRGAYESCRQLGVDFRSVELGDWLMFQQAESEYPVKNITLKSDYSFRITTVDYGGKSDRIEVRPVIPKNYVSLLSSIVEEKQSHTARVVVKGHGVRGDRLWVRGEIQLTIPLDFYYRHAAKFRENSGRLYGGVDVNTDRINLAVVDANGELRDTYTFWFSEATARGYPRGRAWSVIGMRIHEMLRYAYHHGVSRLALENPDVLGRLRLLWVKSGERRHENYNWKVMVFRSRVIEMIALKAPLYSIEVRYVDPKGTTSSEEHSEAMKRYRLDRHTASAYMIAVKGLNLP